MHCTVALIFFYFVRKNAVKAENAKSRTIWPFLSLSYLLSGLFQKIVWPFFEIVCLATLRGRMDGQNRKEDARQRPELNGGF